MKRYLQQLVLAVSICLAFPQPSVSQTGNDNPTGVAGEYNGNITTGGSIDPYTGNAKRFVDDLKVTGSVGKYPLTWTRILNTRGSAGGLFGSSGSWSHSYSWGLWVRPDLPPVPPNPYEGPDGQVSYPDGRIMDLRLEADYVYLQAHGIETLDRLQHVGGGNYDLLMKDGGRVEFRHYSGSASALDVRATAIVDPNGQATTFEYLAGRLHKITEPGQRYLEITYSQISYPWPPEPPNQVVHIDVIDNVKAFDGRGTLIETVTYSYETVNVYHFRHARLIGATYDYGTPAVYTYQPSNVAAGNQWNPHEIPFGMVKTCDDSRYAGPMSKIEYEYTTRSENLAEVAWGQVKKEKYPGGPVVTEVVFPHITYPPNLQAFFQRTEKRPDGSTRLFQYSMGGEGELQSYTDFAVPPAPHHTSTISYTPAPGSDNYRKTLTDARLNSTTTEKEPFVGAVMAVSHPSCTPATFLYSEAQRPYWLITKTDERGHSTHYDRESAPPYRVSQIRYPDGGSESFTYDGNPFGLVHEHQMTSGGTEVFDYDNRGLKTSYTPPWTPSDPARHKTLYFYYGGPSEPGGTPEPPARPDLMDRLRRVIDPRGYSTWYEYNGRGQMTKLIHPDGTFTQSYYNLDGTLQWSEDELQHRTTYTYDEYKRVRTVENAVYKTVTNDYTPPNGLSPLSHTTSSIYLTTLPSQKQIKRDYDSNFRLKETIQGWNTADAAKTSNTYDEVGNLKTVKDPKGQVSGRVTTYAYDNHNRRESVTDADTPPGKTTRWLYDDAGNMTRETRADNKFRTWDLYDPMNRVKHTTGFLGAIEQTSYDYDTAGNLTVVTDPNLRVYQTGYDYLNRKKRATYPPDATTGQSKTEDWRYDFAGNLLWYRNPASQYKHFEYDNRNRPRLSYWNTSENPDSNPTWTIGPKTAITPDAAGRILEIKANNGETIVAYGYDNANYKIWEDQTLTGWPMRRVETNPDDDGNRGTLSVSDVPGDYSFSYSYTPRQQLKQINRGGSSYVEFSYDPNGNLTKRQHMAQGQGHGSTSFQYDDLNRVTICEQRAQDSGTYFARSNYNDYDLVNNLKSISREEDQNTGELFEYDDANQLSSVSYKAVVTPHAPGGAPGGTVAGVEEDGEKETLAALAADPEREPLAKGSVEIEAMSGPRTVTYQNDAINRLSMNDPNIGLPTIFTPNHLNQYTSVTGHGALNYDGNLNVSEYDGWTFVHDAEKRLLSVAGNGHSALFAYDGLGRCVKRTIDGATTVFTYDNWKPVAEWTGAGAFVAWNLYGTGADEILVRYQQNPAGYLHYHLDATGNVQFLLSDHPTNPGLEKYTYDVFGKPTIIGWNGDVRPISNHGNRFLFTGREYLYTFGLYDYRHRIYHPGLGRFIQIDPIGFKGDPLNLYRYCNNNPINHSDPMGLYAVRSGLTPQQKKQVEDAQKVAADKLDRGATAIEYGIASGKDSETFKAVQRDFEGVFHKPITIQDMAKYAKDARNMVTALLDDGRKGYVISGRDQAYFTKNKRPDDVMLGGVGGKSILLNTSLAFKPETELGFSLAWGIAHEAAHNIGIPNDTYRHNAGYKTLTSQEALSNADSYVDFAFGR
jgi:RHS repeat-associated protein